MPPRSPGSPPAPSATTTPSGSSPNRNAAAMTAAAGPHPRLGGSPRIGRPPRATDAHPARTGLTGHPVPGTGIHRHRQQTRRPAHGCPRRGTPGTAPPPQHSRPVPSAFLDHPRMTLPTGTVSRDRSVYGATSRPWSDYPLTRSSSTRWNCCGRRSRSGDSPPVPATTLPMSPTPPDKAFTASATTSSCHGPSSPTPA